MMEQLPPDQGCCGSARWSPAQSGTPSAAAPCWRGSLRTYREDTFRFCRQQLKDIGRSVAAETGCSLDVHLSEGYPAVWNHEELYQKIAAQLGDNAPTLMESQCWRRRTSPSTSSMRRGCSSSWAPGIPPASRPGLHL